MVTSSRPFPCLPYLEKKKKYHPSIIMSEIIGGGPRYRCADGEGVANKCVFWSPNVNISEFVEPPEFVPVLKAS